MIDFSEEDQSLSFGDVMTPMIDVIFVLLAFMMLMINSPLLTMQVDLPKTTIEPVAKKLTKHIVTIGVLVDSKGWHVGGEALADNEALLTRLAKLKAENNNELSVVINSDKNAPVERMIELFSLLQSVELNVTNIALKDSGRQ